MTDFHKGQSNSEMLNEKSNGRRYVAAFPQGKSVGQIAVVEGGMTLRDYFAAKAMQGFICTAGAACLNGLDGYEPHTAKAAYKMADAMLAAREVQS